MRQTSRPYHCRPRQCLACTPVEASGVAHRCYMRCVAGGHSGDPFQRSPRLLTWLWFDSRSLLRSWVLPRQCSLLLTRRPAVGFLPQRGLHSLSGSLKFSAGSMTRACEVRFQFRNCASCASKRRQHYSESTPLAHCRTFGGLGWAACV